MKKIPKIILGLNIIVGAIALVMMLITGILGKFDPNTFWESWDVEAKNDWTVEYPDGSKENVTLPKKIFATRGEPVTFISTVPEDVTDNDAFMFLSMYSSVEIYVEDEMIASFARSMPYKFGRLVGNIRVMAPMKAEYAGKTIRVVYREYHSMEYSFSKVMYGNTGDLKLYVVYANIWRIVIGSILLAVGFICIFLSMMQFMKGARANNIAFWRLGMFILYSLAWLICSSDVPQMFTNKAELISLISFFALSVLPIHYAGFCSEIVPKSKKLFTYLILAGWLAALLEIVGYATDFMDAYDPVIGPFPLLVLNHTVMLLVAFFSIQQSIKYRKTSKHICAYSKANIIFVIMVLIALFFYYTLQTSSLDGLFMGIGLVIFTSMLLVIITKMEIEVLEESRSSELYKELAFVDVQTGLQNRGAFNSIFVDVKFEKNPIVDLVILDVNNLKKTNDSLGHLAGDEMILAAATSIKHGFDGVGKCYRIGGDEFAVVAFDKHDEIQKCLDKMDKRIKAYNEKDGTVKVTVSRGNACMDYDDTNNFMDRLFTMADRKMYENKKYWHAKLAEAEEERNKKADLECDTNRESEGKADLESESQTDAGTEN